MKIKFTHDFRGKLTNENFYAEGSELEMDTDIARELIALNHAVAVEPPVQPVDPEPTPPRRSSKPKAAPKKGDD